MIEGVASSARAAPPPPPGAPGADISVVMITMNEEKAVGKVIGDIQRLLPAAEIVTVDSSRDATPEIAAALGATVIRQFPPQGYGRAMDLALRSYTRPVAVTMDCDDTYPVDFIEPMARMVLD
jgi:glycosyltransferase involved in cell wall biosynthesis